MDLTTLFNKGAIIAHILHHASKEEVYGVWLLEELKRHGYHIGPSNLYPWLKQMRESGLLDRFKKVEEGKVRKYYTITPKGLNQLEYLKRAIVELYEELCKQD